METWKDIFVNQVASGKFWKKLFKDDFESHAFLDRSDAVYICKKAQSDIYDSLIKKSKIAPITTEDLEKAQEDIWAEDISDLGMLPKNKTIQEEMADKLKKSPNKNDIAVMQKVTEMCKELLNDKNVQATADKMGEINICLEQNINVSINIKTV